MNVPISEVGYTSATTGKGDHEVHKGHVVALEEKSLNGIVYSHRKTEILFLTTREVRCVHRG
jgi:hypothetical protein